MTKIALTCEECGLALPVIWFRGDVGDCAWQLAKINLRLHMEKQHG